MAHTVWLGVPPASTQHCDGNCRPFSTNAELVCKTGEDEIEVRGGGGLTTGSAIAQGDLEAMRILFAAVDGSLR
ncbi:hypothetical protein ASC96_09800 [Rhizobium sp. Root1204]|nr:hypothetical protein ASC96_09800 [Rhizobium sp. Root1204]